MNSLCKFGKLGDGVAELHLSDKGNVMDWSLDGKVPHFVLGDN